MTTEQNKPETGAENNPAQNELDLEFNQIEPITPKKPIASEPSFFNKAKGIMNSFTRKETPEAQFSVRKEPTFGANADVQNAPQGNQTNSVPPTATSVNDTATGESAANPQSDAASLNSQQPQNTSAPTKSLKNPENWAILQALPPKYRRIFIALLIAIIILLIVSWLKPSSETVHSFEQSSTTIPTQFQSLDQSQPLENTVLDNINNAQNEQPADLPATNATDANAQREEQNAASPTADNSTLHPADSQPAATQAPAVQPAPSQPTTENKADTAPMVAPQPVQPQPTQQPSHSNNVRSEVNKPARHEQATPSKPAKPAQNVKASESKTAPAAKAERKGAPVVEAKATGASAAKQSASVTTGKTLTVPQGVTLMQVFRDNNLNIADVNAMTKASGAGNVLSSFKPGDKVQVSLNGQGRVSELRLSNGSRFVRQADGSYHYKK
ncbi:opacity-associated protein OapA [Necropsobacter massiliensis]|uniref:opacity-associated protein OapA n=1 Tax=Necropsobacter massiliensis TaxID=1400001 RepID=UPI0005962AE5|nr:opacity-associated protein OapA [Necropsobacter massiliensis]